MKRAYFKRKLYTAPKKKAALSIGVKSAKKKKEQLPSIKKLRAKADSLCTPVSLKLNPNCLLCGTLAQVGHHAVKKSQSNNLRYYIQNLISLCNPCHFKLHRREAVWCPRIVSIKGMEWWKDIESRIWVTVKTDRFFYSEAIERLTAILSL